MKEVAPSTDKSLDRIRRRKFFIPACVFGLIIVVIFSAIDYLEGDTTELFTDFAMGVILVASAIGIFKFDADRTVYTLGLNLLNLAILYNVSLGAGSQSALHWLFISPLLAFFFLEKPEALVSIALFFAIVVLLLAFPGIFDTFDYGISKGLRFLVSLIFVAIIAYGLETSRSEFSKRLKRSNEALHAQKMKLEKALSEIKIMSGMLPICASCKKIRDDQGYWNQIEAYIEDHSDAELSHSICPDCARKWYPDFKLYNGE